MQKANTTPEKKQTTRYDVIIIGAGAAGLMCAIEAGKRGRKVLVLDHAKKPAQKIRISGGGRCNFTNLHTTHANFLSKNPHYCRSALSRYTPQDFIALVEKHGIAYHEKTLGQLFCNDSSQQIIDMLLSECEAVGVTLQLETSVTEITRDKYDDKQCFTLTTNRSDFTSESLVIATGALSIPKMGATGFGYEIAKQFEIPITPTRAALVPFTFEGDALTPIKDIAGLALPISATHAKSAYGKAAFDEAMLFTHRGLSGPAILQISSYWQEGETLIVNLLPHQNAEAMLLETKHLQPKTTLNALLNEHLPKRLAKQLCEDAPFDRKLAEIPNKELSRFANTKLLWHITPNGTEGYRTAEVTLGGIDTNALNAKTNETKEVSGLYFIGEVVDVTGHLGGHNFQWAWASGYVTGQAV